MLTKDINFNSIREKNAKTKEHHVNAFFVQENTKNKQATNEQCLFVVTKGKPSDLNKFKKSSSETKSKKVVSFFLEIFFRLQLPPNEQPLD